MHRFNSVLIVEDNPGDSRLVQEYLKDRFGAGCQVRLATTLQQGLQSLAAEPSDVVLLDLGLPDSSGLDTYFAVNAAAPDVPVVILTGDDSEEIAETALQGGADDFLPKRHADSVALVRAMRHAVQRRRLTQRLRASEALQRAIVETAEEAVLLVDSQAGIDYANPRLETMRGVHAAAAADTAAGTAADATPLNLLALVSDVSAATVRRLLAVDPGQRATGEMWLRHADGRPRATLAAAAQLAQADVPAGANPLWVVMLSDVDGLHLARQRLQALVTRLEQRVAERTRELEMSNADLAAFNRNVAHDLRTPLNAILGFASILQRDPSLTLNAAQQRQLHTIAQSARGMDALIDGLLRLARLGRQQLQRQPVDLSALAQELADTLQASDPQRVVQWQIEPGLRADADPQMLRDMLANLLQNAWKYSGRQPSALISLARQPADAQHPAAFAVRDNGVGFDPATTDRLFEPFQRLVSAQGFAGSGIGLATVRRIVERHGGSIWAHGAPGQGASFFFTLGPAANQDDDNA